MSLDEIGHRPFHPWSLQVDVEVDLGPHLEHLTQRPDAHRGTARWIAVGLVEPVTRVEPTQILEIPPFDRARAVRCSFEGRIVEHHNNPVPGDTDVRLDIAVTQVDGALERLGSVLRPQHPAPAVGQANRVFEIEIRHRHDRSLARVFRRCADQPR